MTSTRSYFVTGTDTGVGKTLFAVGVLASVRRRGRAVAALKPAETGCRKAEDGHLLPDDALRLRAAAGLDSLPLDVIVPHRYVTPVAPAVAGRLENRPFSLPRLLKCRDSLLAGEPDLFLVEGAGGLLVPYVDDFLGADLAAALGMPLLIVARAGLGTLNHTLLTINEARRRGLAIAGVVLNQLVPDGGVAEETNRAELARLTDVPILGTLPYLADAEREDLERVAEAVAASVRLDTLL